MNKSGGAAAGREKEGDTDGGESAVLEIKALNGTIKGSLACPHARAIFGHWQNLSQNFHFNQGLHLDPSVKGFTLNLPAGSIQNLSHPGSSLLQTLTHYNGFV